MRSRVATVFLVGIASSTAMLAIPSIETPQVADANPSTACTLIGKARLAAVLGVRHLEERSTIGPRYPAASDGRMNSKCFVEAWHSRKPRGTKKQEEAIGRDAGAEFVLTTFATDTNAPPQDQQSWVGAGQGYERQLMLEKRDPRLLLGILHASGSPGSLFRPPMLGAEVAEGFQIGLPKHGLRHRVREATAFWADTSSHSILAMSLIEGTHKSIVRRKFERIARIVVPAFGL